MKSTPKVTGFVGGTANRPTPISQKEVDAILRQVQEGVEKPRPKVLFETGEAVRVKEGPFTDFHGNVEDVNYEKSKLRGVGDDLRPVDAGGTGFLAGREGLSFGRVANRGGRRSRTCGPLEPNRRRQWRRKSSASSSCRCRPARRIPRRPIGPALGQRGLNIMEFCKAFNAQTQKVEPGLPIPVVITAYADKSFTFIMKTPPATVLIKKAAKVEKGSRKPHTDKVGKLTRAQAEEIAKTKMPDLTAADLDAAVRTIAGSARSMGITVEGVK